MFQQSHVASLAVLQLALILLLLIVATSPSNAVIIQLNSTEFREMAMAGEFNVIVDTRTQSEWETGHIENATFLDSLQNANTADEIATIADLNGCENCPIVIYCRSGSRAAQALQKLELAGFQGPLYNGLGVNQWTEAGYELVDTPSLIPPCKNEDPEEPPTCAKSALEGSFEKTEAPATTTNGVGIASDVNVTITMPDEPPILETEPPTTTKPPTTPASELEGSASVRRSSLLWIPTITCLVLAQGLVRW